VTNVKKYYVTDFLQRNSEDIGEGKYWFAVEERVRKNTLIRTKY
jgi:hypothetical protein